MKNSSFPYAQTATPPKTGPVTLARLCTRFASEKERANAAAAGQIILAWHSPHVTDDDIAGIGLDPARVCLRLLNDRPDWLEHAWERLVILLGALAGEALACGSIRRSSVTEFREQGGALASLLADNSGNTCPWPDEDPAGDPAEGVARIMNIALRRAKLLLRRDRSCFEALRTALATDGALTDAEINSVISIRPWTV